jgi:hypothetical protein
MLKHGICKQIGVDDDATGPDRDDGAAHEALRESQMLHDRKKRVGRLNKLRNKMHPFVNEQARLQTGPGKRVQQQVRGSNKYGFAEVCLPQVFTEHYGGELRRRKETGSEMNANPGMLVEVFMPIIGAPLDGQMKQLKRNADHGLREHSIASSTTRSKELVHALPSAAKSRNVAAAKPGR